MFFANTSSLQLERAISRAKPTNKKATIILGGSLSDRVAIHRCMFLGQEYTRKSVLLRKQSKRKAASQFLINRTMHTKQNTTQSECKSRCGGVASDLLQLLHPQVPTVSNRCATTAPGLLAPSSPSLGATIHYGYPQSPRSIARCFVRI